MKTFTVILLFAVILGCYIEVVAGNVNASGHVDAYILVGRRRSLHQKHQASRNEDDDANSAWSHASDIPNSVTPTSSNDPIRNETGSNNNERPHAHQHRSRHRASRH